MLATVGRHVGRAFAFGELADREAQPGCVRDEENALLDYDPLPWFRGDLNPVMAPQVPSDDWGDPQPPWASNPDVLWAALMWLDSPDLAHASATCRWWYQASSSDFVWRALWTRQFDSGDLAPPALPRGYATHKKACLEQAYIMPRREVFAFLDKARSGRFWDAEQYERQHRDGIERTLQRYPDLGRAYVGHQTILHERKSIAAYFGAFATAAIMSYPVLLLTRWLFPGQFLFPYLSWPLALADWRGLWSVGFAYAFGLAQEIVFQTTFATSAQALDSRMVGPFLANYFVKGFVEGTTDQLFSPLTTVLADGLPTVPVPPAFRSFLWVVWMFLKPLVYAANCFTHADLYYEGIPDQ
eukprot:gene377-2418_t